MSDIDRGYIKAIDELPKENVPVWVRICGMRPRKMYRIGENVLWKYCK